MNLSEKVKRLWLVDFNVDFRKAHQGLLGEVYSLGLSPLAGDAVIFIGKDKKRIKILYVDGNGLWVNYKIFHKGIHKMYFNFSTQKSCKSIRRSELSLLLDGASYTVHKFKT